MNQILTEKQYQAYILGELQKEGYTIRDTAAFDGRFAVDREMLFGFLEDTQPETMAKLRKIYKGDLEETFLSYFARETSKAGGSLIEALKHGLTVSGFPIDFLYTPPAASFNQKLTRLYEKNRFTVMEEVWAGGKERVDLVFFVNGIAIMTAELKCNPAGQTYHDAIRQYRRDRNPEDRLFRWKAGALVHFAMDLEEVYMTTRLAREKTFFLPFNRGRGEGIHTGKGNPLSPEGMGVSYMWEDIWKPDTVISLISQYIFVETKTKKDPATGKKRMTDTLIFPRYHQLDAVRKILADVRENGSSQNYLIQHSTGSGKTNSIAWLAYRLSSLHDGNNRIIFDNILIVTDRVVVDRQLQDAILGMEHKSGLIRVMDDSCTSADLAEALAGNTKIIATTIQKFPYITDRVRALKDKRFAVIIDEAHSSTSGKDMAAVTLTLSADESAEEQEDLTVEDRIVDEIARHGKQPNVSMFAFTATPKGKTLAQFGRLNRQGQYEAFHLYSMKQAIEEGFILDVLQDYTTYQTFYRLNKAVEEDPRCKTIEAKRQIARFLTLHPTNIAQRIQIIVEHFREYVKDELGGAAKAMIVTPSRQAAVLYKQALERYIAEKGYTDVRALVAFSGKVKLPGDPEEYSEPGINGFGEAKLPDVFDSAEYNVLLVANKYQTGFDQPKLCAMYILKKLRGVSAVQTLSRLNRIDPPYDKHVFVLDFVNDYEDIQKAYATYYTTTILSQNVTPQAIYELDQKLEGYYVLSPADIEDFSDRLYKTKQTGADRKQMLFYLSRARRAVEEKDRKEQLEFRKTAKHFIHFYQFLIQVTSFEDAALHKKVKFLEYLVKYIVIPKDGSFDITSMIKAQKFRQKKTGEHKGKKVTPDPIVRLPMATHFDVAEEKKEKLSRILEDINARMGMNLDTDVTVSAIYQIVDLMKKSQELRDKARSNTLSDFELSYLSDVDDVLADAYEHNTDFFGLLLNDEEAKKDVLGLFAPEIYEELKGKKPTYAAKGSPAAPAAMAAEGKERYPH